MLAGHKTWDVDPEQVLSRPPLLSHSHCHCRGPIYSELSLMTTDWEVMQGLLVTWRPLEWQWSDPDSTELLMTCDPPPTMTRGSSVTQRDNCLGKCWLISRHADIISQLSWCLYLSLEISSSFSCLYFARMRNLWDAEAFEVSMTLITRSELRAPGDQGVKVTSNVYFHIWWYLHIGGDWGFEVGLLTYLSLKQMEKVSFLNPKCPFLHLGKLANTRNSIRKDFSL